ncbi:MAG: hypothetical protein HGA53_07945 [Anaerolineaceae bacterium]|nr:hypothetical protein [Anaerolineaceae bacterium]
MIEPTKKIKRMIAAGFIGLAVGVILLVSLPTQRGLAQASTPQPTRQVGDDEVNKIAKDMYCPICENIPLDVCPTVACKEWRELIREKLGEGWSRKQIEELFALRYSDRVLAVPPPNGLNLLIYVAPPLTILIGVVIVIRVLRKKLPASAAKTDAQLADDRAAADDPYLQKFEAELKKRDNDQ